MLEYVVSYVLAGLGFCLIQIALELMDFWNEEPFDTSDATRMILLTIILWPLCSLVTLFELLRIFEKKINTLFHHLVVFNKGLKK